MLHDEVTEQLRFGFDETNDGGTDVEQRSTKRRPWAWLLRHVWQVDVSTCELCAGPMKWVEAATEPQAIARVLREIEHGPDTMATGQRQRSVVGRHPSSFGLGLGRVRVSQRIATSLIGSSHADGLRCMLGRAAPAT